MARLNLLFLYVEDGRIVHRKLYTDTGSVFKEAPSYRAERWVHSSLTNKKRSVFAVYVDKKEVDQCSIAFRGWRVVDWNNLPAEYRMELLVGIHE